LLSRRQIWLGFSACAIVLLAGAKGAFAQIFYQGGTCVPEIDPTTAISGLMLAAGGAMLLVERYRYRK